MRLPTFILNLSPLTPSKTSVRADLWAGLTVALVLIPQSMAYAELAGLPPWAGLYASFLPVILGGLLGSSNHLQTGPVAMIALITASFLGTLAEPGSLVYGLLAAKLAFLIGLLWLAAGLLRLAFVINFISKPVIEGFVHAGAVIISTSQLGKMLGLPQESGSHYLKALLTMLTQLEAIHWTNLGLGGSALLILLLRKRLPKLPWALIIVIISTAAVYFFELSNPEKTARPLHIVGIIPSGIPTPIFPIPASSEWIHLLPGALTISLVGFMEMSSVARALAARSHQKLNLNKELIGQAAASVSSALSGGFPISGSFSRSALNYSVGARSGLSSIFTGLFVLIFLLFFTPYLYYLPKTVLAAIIMAAVVNLMNFRKLWHYVEVNRADGVAAWTTFISTLIFAPHLEYGILLGAAISILLQLYRMMRPRIPLLGIHPDGTLRDAEKHQLEVDDTLPTIRLDDPLIFANCYYFEERIHETIEHFPKARYLAIIGNGMNQIDTSGTEILKEIDEKLAVNGTQLLFVGIQSAVREAMRRSGLESQVGEENFFSDYTHARTEAYARLPSDQSYAI